MQSTVLNSESYLNFQSPRVLDYKIRRASSKACINFHGVLKLPMKTIKCSKSKYS